MSERRDDQMYDPFRPGSDPDELLDQFGNIDIYLFDQLLRGRVKTSMQVLDAGCGPGRNAHYLLRCGINVCGIDADPLQIERVRALAAALAPAIPPDSFRVGSLSDIPWPDARFDFVICSAVLHFADDEAHFERMFAELWRVLSPGGILFARLASTIGIEEHVRHVEGRRYALGDGTERFLVDEPYLLRVGSTAGAILLDPLKTTNVQNLRAMTTWVLQKQSGSGT